MQPKRRLWQLFVMILAAALAVTAALGYYALHTFEERYEHRLFEHLRSRAYLVELQARSLFLTRASPARFDEISKQLGKISATHVTLILPSGAVAGDSEESPDRLENYGNRPEVREALLGRTGVEQRPEGEDDDLHYYLAVPVKKDEQVLGAVRVSLPPGEVEHPLEFLQAALIALFVVSAMVLAASGFVFVRRISRPLSALSRFADRFALGETDAKLPLTDAGEIGELESALNRMADRWKEKVRDMSVRRSEQDTVLASMMEGVIAVDMEERIVNMNQAAGRLLGIAPASAIGRAMQEVIRNTQIQQFVSATLSSHRDMEEDVSLLRPERQGEMFLQIHGTMWRNALGEDVGALIVMNDITRLRKLETIRKEFVANVSHELKTPITSIKGWVETLLNGDLSDPQEVRKFLEVVARQSDRLNAIIEDLLSLSRIEQDEEKAAIALEEGAVLDVIRSAIIDCRAKAQEKKIHIETVCEKEIKVKMEPRLLGQALVNLIDNAVKYSEPGGRVEVSAMRTDKEVVISVQDGGCGIPADHLPRLFERFYRVDKARSRKLGGTGLGLAIVKHIAQAHKGSVEVASLPGKGSRFSIHLPVS